MRHRYTHRLVISLAGLLILASLAFAAIAAFTDRGASVRLDSILELDGDIDRGETVYREVSEPSCGSCHSLAAADARSDRAVDLDELQPSERQVAVSIVSGAIGAHEAQDYRIGLSDRDVADLAAFVSGRAGD